ncbi:hypothetical protein ACIOWI_21300 [Streptomyces sp. NPDC087659]|uniref:hypothetical protein n=1 Tax=Streptomyces sp. NPDC087659 TaxID=3365801 RepID=UPI0038131ACC
MASPCPEASFDVLYVVREMGKQQFAVTSPEVQLFCYLSCLLGLYDGRPVADWGYEFAATPSIAPFSTACGDSLEALEFKRFLHEKDGAYSITASGVTELERWGRLSLFRGRIAYLSGATGAATAIPVAALSNGVALDPQIVRATRLHDSRPLLEEVGLSSVYEQFRALESALGGEVRDFMVPAVVWLSYLLRQEEKNAENPSGGR